MKPAIIAIALLGSSGAYAGWSANLGFASDYFFRGIYQAQSSASGGIDYENSGFYAGVWAADVSDGLSAGYPGTDAAGLEVDGYFGYGGEVGDFSYGIGYTGYFYTDDFDDTYRRSTSAAATASRRSMLPLASTTTSTGRRRTTPITP